MSRKARCRTAVIIVPAAILLYVFVKIGCSGVVSGRTACYWRGAVASAIVCVVIALAACHMAGSRIVLMREKEENYRDVEELSRGIVENSPDAITVADSQGSILRFNRGAEELTGFREEEVLGKNVRGLYADREEPDRIMALLDASGRLANYETTIIGKDGRHIPIALSLSFLKDSRGEVKGTVGVSKDLTALFESRERARRALEELRHRHAELEEAHRRLKLLDQLKTDFVSTVSHELRTPLGSVKGYLDVLLDGEAGPLSERQKDFLSTASRNAERLVSLINDLLDISRIEAGRLELRVEEVDIKAVVARSMDNFRKAAAGKTLALQEELQAVGTVAGDARRLEQIVDNLLSNAVKFTPPGGTVKVALGRKDKNVLLSVEDSGPGIPPAARKQIFEKFYRSTDVSGQPEGIGLGLSIVRSLVERHGGEVRVESEPGRGSCFTVELPRSRQRMAFLAEVNEKLALAREVPISFSVVLVRAVTNYDARVAGDEVRERLMEAVRTAISGTMRSSDVVSRCGDEELGMVFEADRTRAKAALGRAKQAAQSIRVEHDGAAVAPRLVWGLSSFPADGTTLFVLEEAARMELEWGEYGKG